MQLPRRHVPPLHLPKPISVSHTHSLPSISLPQGQKEDFQHLGPPSARFPWPMTKAIASMSVGGRELVLLVTSSSNHAFCSSHPFSITQSQCRFFCSQKYLNQEFFRTSQYRVTEVRTPPTFTPALLSSPSMKMPRRASCNRGTLSLKRYVLQIKVLLYCCRSRLHPMFLSTQREGASPHRHFPFSPEHSGSALVC